MFKEIKERTVQIQYGNIPKGYKMSRIGIIPDDWEVKKLKIIGKFKKGKNISTNDTIDYGLPAMMYGDIYVKYDTRFNDVDYRISKETAKDSTSIKNMDLLFTCSGETAKEIGKCVCYTGDQTVYIGGDILAFTQSECNSVFLAYQQNGYQQTKQKARMSQGHSVVHIYEKHLSSLWVPLPSLPEQNKIAEILSTQDKVIELKEKMLAEKKLQKKYLMQVLLNPNSLHFKRLPGFSGEWNEKRLKSYVSFIKNGYTYSEAKENGVKVSRIETISNGYIDFNKVGYAKYDNKIEKFKMKEGDILYSHINSLEHVGKVAIYEDDNSLYHGMNLLNIRANESMCYSKFLYYLLCSSTGKRMALSYAKRAIGQCSISAGEILKYKFKVPDTIQEQITIANIIEKYNEQILLLEAQIAKERFKKKALMQLLLTGKVRVKV